MKARVSFVEIFLVLLLIGLIDGGIYYYFIKPTIAIYPNADFHYATYTDKTEYDGKSSIKTDVTDEGIMVTYVLRKKYEWPFAGLRLKPQEPLNLKMHDYMELDVSVTKEQSLIVALWTALGGVNTDLSEAQPHFYSITLYPHKRSYKIPIPSFRIPDWWLAEYKIGLNELPANLLEEVVAIGFQTNNTESIDVEHKFIVQNIKIAKNNIPIYIIMGLLGLITFLYLLLRIMWKKSRGKKILIPLKEFVDSHDYAIPLTRIVSVIGQNYDNPALTITSVAQTCHLTEDEVANCLRDEFGMNFMEYHDRVRIENHRNRAQHGL